MVDSWTSVKGKTHDFGSKLKAGESYILKETVAPDGYEVISDTEFTISKFGKVRIELPSIKDADGNIVYLVENARKPVPTVTPTVTPVPTEVPEDWV